jgi:uncharacterized membrane protein
MVALLGAVVVLGFAALALVVPFVSLVRSARAARDIRALRAEIADLRRTVAAPAPPPIAAVPPVPFPQAAEPENPAPEAPASPRPASEAHGPGAAASEAPGPEAAASEAPGPAVAAPTAPGPDVAPADATPPRLPPMAAASSRPSALETRIGARWLLYAALASLILGVAFFVKFAFDNAWVTPAARVLIGAAGGATLIAAGTRLARRGLGFFGDMLAAGGLVMLYVATYAAFNFYGLVGPTPAFGLMAAVTGLAAGLADTRRAQGLALLALAGGFATPFLVSPGRPDHVQLFTYDAVLVAGTLWLARRRRWPTLHVVSFALTWFTVLTWLAQGYRPTRWASTAAFLTLFCALFLGILATLRRPPRTAATRLAAAVLWLGPVIYHLAMLAVLWPHVLLTAAYLIAFSAGGIALAAGPGTGWTRLAVLGLAAPPMSGWIAAHGGATWLAAGTTAVVAIYGLHLLASLRTATGDGARPGAADVALLHAEGAWLFGGLYGLYADHALAWMGTLAMTLALWNAVLAAALARGGATSTAESPTGVPAASETWLHLLALALAFAGAACWLELDPRWVAAAWAAEGAALLWLGHTTRREWLRLGGLLVLLVAWVRVAEALLAPGAVLDWPLVNVRTGVALFLGALLAWLGTRARRQARTASGAVGEGDLLIVAAAVLGLLILTSEVTAAFDRRAWLAAPAGQAGPVTTAALARDVSLSLGWAAYALAVLVLGIRRRDAPLRYLAIAVFALTLGKLVVVDLDRLERGWRILSFLGLGALMLGASALYQRVADRDD